MKKAVFIDHYDSFSDTLLDWLAGSDNELSLERYYADDLSKVVLRGADLLVLSAGPLRPENYPASCNLAKQALGKVPIVGVCLGSQILGTLADLTIRRSTAPFHGTPMRIVPEKSSAFFADVVPFEAATYHSLVVAPPTNAKTFSEAGWQIAALARRRNTPEAEIAAIEHQSKQGSVDAIGFQFHPESFLSENSSELRSRIFAMAQGLPEEAEVMVNHAALPPKVAAHPLH